MVRLVNEAGPWCLPCRPSKDIRSSFNLLYLRTKFMALEGALEKLPPSGSASSELEGVVEQLHYLQDVSCQIINKLVMSPEVPAVSNSPSERSLLL